MIFFDGSCDKNPGPAACGFTVNVNGAETHFEIAFLGFATNNIAEYNGLLNALKYCEVNRIYKQEIYGDSLLVVNQVNGLWKVKSDKLKQLNVICKDLMKRTECTLQWVPRESNERADQLSRIALRYTRDKAMAD